MEESSTYQAIFQKGVALGIARSEIRGRIEVAQRMLLRAGEQRMGKPPERVTREMINIDSLERLEALAYYVLQFDTWDEFLASA